MNPKQYGDRYRSILGGNDPQSFLDSVAPGDGGQQIDERADGAQAELHRIVREYMGGEPQLLDLATFITEKGRRALRLLVEGDDARLVRDRALLDGLEAIIRTDGSRPSFLVRNDEVDRRSSPLGEWATVLDDCADQIRYASSCVGRIDDPRASQGFQGTGFLVADDLILTNRHVLQCVAARDQEQVWRFESGVSIDFGHELEGVSSARRRALRSVVFAGSQPISTRGPVDHTKLDLALIELEPATDATRPQHVLGLDIGTNLPNAGVQVATIGYPAYPRAGSVRPTLLEQLFRSMLGYKRFAPGIAMTPSATGQPWTTAHDATTLGGNSGSAILILGKKTTTAALHYGGRATDPAENWGHVLEKVLDSTDGQNPVKLRQILEQRGVKLVGAGL